MKTTQKEIHSWIRRQQGKKKPSVIYITWLKKQQIRVTTTAEVKQNEKS